MTADTVVAYLHGDGWTHSYGKSLTQMLMANPGGHIGDLIDSRCNSGGLPEGRNAAMAHFLDDTDLDWLLFIDTDMGFKPEAIVGLHTVADPDQRPIVGALCFGQREMVHDGRNGYRWEPRPTIFDYVQDPDGQVRFHYRAHYPVNSLLQCDATGAAFLMIHRRAGEAIRDRFGETWFDRIEDPDGLVSEDLSFFKRWHDINGPGGCHVHTGVKTTHAKTTWIDERDFWERLPVLPATERVEVIVPVLNRPQNAKPFMESLRASTGLATVTVVCEYDDLESERAWLAAGADDVIRSPEHHTFAEKVNLVLMHSVDDSEWIFIVGDDVMFHPGWLDYAQFAGNAYGQAGVVGTNDLGNPRVMGGDHATHLLIRRSYIDEVGASWDGPGTVCHEGYRHWFVDDEIVTAAKQRNQWQMALGSKVEHMHPYWGKGQSDEVYELGQSHAAEDRATHLRRVRQFAPEYAPPPGPGVFNLYQTACHTPSDIYEHLPVIFETVLYEEAETVVELGVRSGNSTVALLAALDRLGDGQLISVDTVPPVLPEAVHDHERWTCIVGDDLDPEVVKQIPDEIDVLFIDTSHTYDQTKAELETYGDRARVVLLHDTELKRPDASPPTDPDYPVKVAVTEWCEQTGRTFENHPHNNGLGVIR